jgi:hypothetical protein
MPRRRVAIVKQRTRWTGNDWQRGWELAMTRIDGVPPIVGRQPLFQDCLTVLDGAFTDGDRFLFEIGLSTLIDYCAETVSRGECKPWWDSCE